MRIVRSYFECVYSALRMITELLKHVFLIVPKRKLIVFTPPPVKVINNSLFDAIGYKFSLHSSNMCKYLVQTSPVFEEKLMDTVPGKQIKFISFDVCLLPTHGLFVFIKQIIKLHFIVWLFNSVTVYCIISTPMFDFKHYEIALIIRYMWISILKSSQWMTSVAKPTDTGSQNQHGF